MSQSNQYGTFANTPVAISTPLVMSSPAADDGLQWDISKPLMLLASANVAATGQSVTFNFDCGTAGIFTVPGGSANVALYYVIDPSYSTHTCSIYASGTYFIDSPPVSVVLLAPTSLSTDLNAWQGGAEASVLITAIDGNVFPLTMNVHCPTLSQSFDIYTGSVQTLLLNVQLNGLACQLTTTNLPQYYIPITPTVIAIKISTAEQQEIIRRLSPESLVKSLFAAVIVEGDENQDQQKKMMHRRRRRPCSVQSMRNPRNEKSRAQ